MVLYRYLLSRSLILPEQFQVIKIVIAMFVDGMVHVAVKQILFGGQVGGEIELEITGIDVVVHHRANVDVDLVPTLWSVVFLVSRCLYSSLQC